MRVTCTVEGLDRVIAKLKDIERRHIPFAVSKALNDTAADVRRDEQIEMKRVFHRVVPFILNSMFIAPSSKKEDRFYAEIGFKSDTSGARRIEEAMRPQIFGGERKLKPSEWLLYGEYFVPGGAAKLDRYGNLSRSQLEQVLSMLKRFPEAGYQANVTRGSRLRNRKRRDYFSIASKRGGLVPGVWEKAPGGTPKPIMIYIKSPHYRKRFRFYEVAEASARRNFQRRFFAAMEYALRGTR